MCFGESVFIPIFVIMKLIRKIIVLALCLLVVVPVGAQRRRRAAARPKTTKKVVHNELFNSMLLSTAKVMFIDSVVVGKEDFLSQLKMSPEAGTVSVRSNKFPGVMMPLTQYENQLGDRRIFADGDTTATGLYAATRLGDGWSKAEPLEGISQDTYLWQDFPFLMPDGVTLFFSAKGPQSMGGRDIFMTNYDADKGTYYEPQNYGLPFNSEANEYLLAIDDVDTLGWLVSDRFQPKDSVCIYTFVPTNPRVDFQSDDLPKGQLEKYARLTSISDTWHFGNRWGAIQRRDKMLERIKAGTQKQAPVLVVNDGLLARSASDLKTTEGRKLYQQWLEVNGMVKDTQSTLDGLRRQMAQSGSQTARDRVLKLEDDLERQRSDLKMLAKQIRKLENR